MHLNHLNSFPIKVVLQVVSVRVERLQHYFTANDVADADKQRAILLSSVGPTTYRLIRNLLAPDKPTDKTFKAITDVVREHHMPKPSVIMQRFTFHSRT